MRRVVVTGLGAVTPLGRTVTQRDRVIKVVPELKAADLPCHIAALVDWVPKGSSSTSRFIDFAVITQGSSFQLEASEQALDSAGWKPTTEEEKDRAGVCIASGMGAFGDIVEAVDTLRERGQRRISPFFVPRLLANMAAGNVSIAHGFQACQQLIGQGPNLAPATACAAGAHAIGEAFELIKSGRADRMLAGGTEAAVHPLSVVGFTRAKALATSYNENPGAASRPFDAKREGFVMGEGAGVLLLEELEQALARQATIYAEVCGFGLTGDAGHITRSTGAGAVRAMRQALAQARLSPAAVSYLNAHATSTPAGDETENAAIKEVFGEAAQSLLVSSTKGATGHLLGAAGAVEAIFSVLALQHQVAPPTLNLDSLEPEMNLNYCANQAVKAPLEVAMSNSFGFGGTNAVLLFKRFHR